MVHTSLTKNGAISGWRLLARNLVAGLQASDIRPVGLVIQAQKSAKHRWVSVHSSKAQTPAEDLL